MKELLKRFWKEEEGFGTVELVILIGVLVTVALIFRGKIIEFVNKLTDKTLNTDNIPEPGKT
jgi:Flp pilus assembly pilin Flp